MLNLLTHERFPNNEQRYFSSSVSNLQLLHNCWRKQYTSSKTTLEVFSLIHFQGNRQKELRIVTQTYRCIANDYEKVLVKKLSNNETKTDWKIRTN